MMQLFDRMLAEDGVAFDPELAKFYLEQCVHQPERLPDRSTYWWACLFLANHIHLYDGPWERTTVLMHQAMDDMVRYPVEDWDRQIFEDMAMLMEEREAALRQKSMNEAE